MSHILLAALVPAAIAAPLRHKRRDTWRHWGLQTCAAWPTPQEPRLQRHQRSRQSAAHRAQPARAQPAEPSPQRPARRAQPAERSPQNGVKNGGPRAAAQRAAPSLHPFPLLSPHKDAKGRLYTGHAMCHPGSSHAGEPCKTLHEAAPRVAPHTTHLLTYVHLNIVRKTTDASDAWALWGNPSPTASSPRERGEARCQGLPLDEVPGVLHGLRKRHEWRRLSRYAAAEETS